MKKCIVNGSVSILVLSTILYSCNSTEKATQQKQTIGINQNFMDKSVNPADNFNRYVNGSWLDNTEIPADRTRWGSFDEL